MKEHDKSQNRCPLAKKCGGCQLQNMNYEKQLSWKMGKVVSLFGKMGRVQQIAGMDNPYYYRNKVQAAFCKTRGGKIISGVYQAKSHRVVAVESCFTENQTADKIIGTIRKMMPRFRMDPYNEDKKTGFLRHVLVRVGEKSGQVMVVLVCASPVFKSKNRFIEELLCAHPEITTIVQNINNQSTSMVLGEREQVLYGKGYIEDTLCGCVFRISPKSFYQINPTQTEVLYSKAIKMARLTGEEILLDAYCGIGTIGLIASSKCKTVLGVEVNASAVKDAKINAKLNNIENAKFICADAGEYMRACAKSGDKVDVVMMDPPRAGSDIPFLSSVLTLSPKRIVYISCNPETQSRDVRYLVKNGGYKIREIAPVDMFPHTSHIENIISLEK